MTKWRDTPPRQMFWPCKDCEHLGGNAWERTGKPCKYCGSPDGGKDTNKRIWTYVPEGYLAVCEGANVKRIVYSAATARCTACGYVRTYTEQRMADGHMLYECAPDHCVRCGCKDRRRYRVRALPKGMLPVNEGVAPHLKSVRVYVKGSRIGYDFAAESFWHWKWICHECKKMTFVDPDCRHGYMECGWCCYPYGEWWSAKGHLAVDDGVYL